jgi:hypothetical protein
VDGVLELGIVWQAGDLATRLQEEGYTRGRWVEVCLNRHSEGYGSGMR